MDIQRKYPVKRSPADERDFIFKATKYTAETLPPVVDLRPKMSPIVDQGQLGSCTANAIASGLREYLLLQDGQPLTRLSRLYHYWHERQLEGKVNEDSGAYIRDGMKVLADIGCALETDFPYDIAKFTQQPSQQAETDAAKFKIREYHAVTSYDDLKHALAEGKPVVIGIDVYESFETMDTAMSGMIPVPKPGEKVLGGHCMLAVGYTNQFSDQERIIVRNSWGEHWGQEGYCMIPKAFFDAGYAFDMWTGSTKITADNLPLADAVKFFIDKGIFDTPDFWTNFDAKQQAGTLTSADQQYTTLALRKIAAYLINQGG